ncbi:sugar ABC transporter substrate-binding protein [Saliterribacillus persicus]|uniref:Monosaccharide ABC transporter substrate-binding protein (CUT2 family) n=1 Tax=Saliterribacillus persicus TaxID=930114 RepID=A0A368XVH1_9BACI|nr:sugar ABC transporter substrate-binding protein [Saliterribacillus persicus]RCW71942.1 monosaccharide ABC transporter substrate-binding protein (CUT2 family) [Saliterribacillus persicus]
MKNLKFLAVLFFVFMLSFLVACGTEEETSSEGEGAEGSSGEESEGEASLEGVPEAFQSEEQLKVMVVRKIGGDDHTAQYLAGAKREGEALGMQVDTFSANGDTAKFHDTINQAIDQGYDGLVISHGDDEATVELVQEARDSGIEVVTFDSNQGLMDVEGVTLTSQDDEALATLALDKLVEEQAEDANILYLWVDGFPPMVRRNAVYQDVLEANPDITELERFGVASENTSVDTQNAVASMLNKYPEGEIDAIFATWDAFAIGATRALNEANRTEIDVYGIDVSNADLQMMQEEGSPWKYTAAVDPMLIGSVNIRILAKKIAEEETPQTYDLEASLISQEALLSAEEEVNMQNLVDVIDGWGETSEFEEDWMITLKENN